MEHPKLTEAKAHLKDAEDGRTVACGVVAKAARAYTAEKSADRLATLLTAKAALLQTVYAYQAAHENLEYITALVAMVSA